MPKHTSTKVIQTADLFYFGKPLGKPVVISSESWNAAGQLSEIRKWDLHGKFESWTEMSYRPDGQVDREMSLDSAGQEIALGIYNYDDSNKLSRVDWMEKGLPRSWVYFYDQEGRLEKVLMRDKWQTISKTFLYSYSEKGKTVEERPNEHMGQSSSLYSPEGLLLEKSIFYHQVRLDDQQRILPGKDVVLDRKLIFRYNEHGDLVEVLQGRDVAEEFVALEQWAYIYDSLGRKSKKSGSYKGSPQISVDFRYEDLP